MNIYNNYQKQDSNSKHTNSNQSGNKELQIQSTQSNSNQQINSPQFGQKSNNININENKKLDYPNGENILKIGSQSQFLNTKEQKILEQKYTKDKKEITINSHARANLTGQEMLNLHNLRDKQQQNEQQNDYYLENFNDEVNSGLNGNYNQESNNTSRINSTRRKLVNDQENFNDISNMHNSKMQEIQEINSQSFCNPSKQSGYLDLHQRESGVSNNSDLNKSSIKKSFKKESVDTMDVSIRKKDKKKGNQKLQQLHEQIQNNKNFQIMQNSVESIQKLQKELTHQNIQKELAKKKRKKKNMHTQLGVQFKCIKFKDNLKMFQKARDYNYITKNIGVIVYDKSFSTIKNCFQKMRKEQIKKLKQYSKNSIMARCIDFFPLIEPSSRFKLIWENFKLFLILVCIFILPIDIVISYKDNMISQIGETYNIFQLFCLCFFFVDIFVIFNTGIFQQGTVIRYRNQIAKKYILEGALFIDIITLIPFIIHQINMDSKTKWWNVFILGKIISFHNIIKEFKAMVFSQQKTYMSLTLFQLLFKIICINHCIACMYLWFGSYAEVHGQPLNWLAAVYIKEHSVFQQYLYALYFSVQTMTTVGYGDILPQNIYEVSFVIVAMLLSSGMFAYIFNSINSLIEEMDQEEKQFKNQIKLVNKYLNGKHISQNLKMQVLKFLEYNFKTDKEVTEKDENFIMGNLSQKLKQQIQFESNSEMIQRCSNVLGMYSERVRLKLTKVLKQRRVKKNDTIQPCDSYDSDPILYIIESGQVEIYADTYTKSENDNTILGTLYPGQFFGEIEFYSGLARQQGVKAKTNCVLYGLSRKTFIELIRKRKPDFEQFCLLKDSVQQNTLMKLNTQCRSCLKFYHTSINCPYTHIKIDKEFMILQGQYGFPQERQKIEDVIKNKNQNQFLKNNRINKKLNPLSILFEIQIQAQAAKEDYEQEQAYKNPKVQVENIKGIFAGHNTIIMPGESNQPNTEDKVNKPPEIVYNTDTNRFLDRGFSMIENQIKTQSSDNENEVEIQQNSCLTDEQTDSIQQNSSIVQRHSRQSSILQFIQKVVEKELQHPSYKTQNSISDSHPIDQKNKNKEQERKDQTKKKSFNSNFMKQLGTVNSPFVIDAKQITTTQTNEIYNSQNEIKRSSLQVQNVRKKNFTNVSQNFSSTLHSPKISENNSQLEDDKFDLNSNSNLKSPRKQQSKYTAKIKGRKSDRQFARQSTKEKGSIWSQLLKKKKIEKSLGKLQNQGKQQEIVKKQLIEQGQLDSYQHVEFNKLDKPMNYEIYHPLFNYNFTYLTQRLKFLAWFQGTDGFGKYTLQNRRIQRKQKNHLIHIQHQENDRGKDLVLRFNNF